MKIGVLALQGSIVEHLRMLRRCNVEAKIVKSPSDMDVDGLIIPGGESTTIGKLMKLYGLDEAIKKRHSEGMAIYGSCAGAILMAKEIIDEKMPKLELMDISIKRNNYGRQVDSFETDLWVNGFDKTFRGVFIRAPVIKSYFNGSKIMSEFGNNPVMIQQDNLLVTTFHPELTDDKRVHEHFIGMIKNS